MVAHATSGVRSKLAGLRRRLRDETSLPVPPALSCGSGPSCCSDMDCTSGIPALAGCPPNEVTKPPPPKKKRKPPSCPECKKANRDTTGHSYHQEGTRATMRYVCSHPSCPRNRSLMATVEAAPKQKRKYSQRTCKKCGAPQTQRGCRDKTRFFCTDISCGFSRPNLDLKLARIENGIPGADSSNLAHEYNAQRATQVQVQVQRTGPRAHLHLHAPALWPLFCFVFLCATVLCPR